MTILWHHLCQLTSTARFFGKYSEHFFSELDPAKEWYIRTECNKGAFKLAHQMLCLSVLRNTEESEWHYYRITVKVSGRQVGLKFHLNQSGLTPELSMKIFAWPSLGCAPSAWMCELFLSLHKLNNNLHIQLVSLSWGYGSILFISKKNYWCNLL